MTVVRSIAVSICVFSSSRGVFDAASCRLSSIRDIVVTAMLQAKRSGHSDQGTMVWRTNLRMLTEHLSVIPTQMWDTNGDTKKWSVPRWTKTNIDELLCRRFESYDTYKEQDNVHKVYECHYSAKVENIDANWWQSQTLHSRKIYGTSSQRSALALWKNGSAHHHRKSIGQNPY